MEWYHWVIIFIVIVVVFNWYTTKKRREYLTNKYQNHQLVEKMMKKMFWQGQTEEQLFDSLGKPADIVVV